MITSRTRIVMLIGDPVGHSWSPVMHNAWIADHGLDAVFVACRLPRETAETALRGLKASDLHGLNVTIPHKELAARLADALTPEARLFGAVNVYARGPDGRWTGANTDPAGVLAALDEKTPHWRGQTKRALVIGAGGAGRSIAAALSAANVPRVDLANRTRARADEVAAALTDAGLAGIGVRDWSALGEAFGEADLILNASSLGMKGNNDVAWPMAAARKHVIVFDAVYTPPETPLLQAAAAEGLAVVDGLGMLIHQGVDAFERWFGVRPDAGAARARLLPLLTARA